MILEMVRISCSLWDIVIHKEIILGPRLSLWMNSCVQSTLQPHKKDIIGKCLVQAEARKARETKFLLYKLSVLPTSYIHASKNLGYK